MAITCTKCRQEFSSTYNLVRHTNKKSTCKVDNKSKYELQLATRVDLLELLIRKLLEDFRQENAKDKDIYVLALPLLSKFVKYICDTFSGMVLEKNNLIKDNLDDELNFYKD